MFRTVFIVLHFIFYILVLVSSYCYLLFIYHVVFISFYSYLFFVFLCFFDWARGPSPIQAKAHFICPGLRPKQQAYGRPTGPQAPATGLFLSAPTAQWFFPSPIWHAGPRHRMAASFSCPRRTRSSAGHTLLRPSSFHAFPVRVEFSPARLSLSPCTCTRPKHHVALITLAQVVEVQICKTHITKEYCQH